MSKILDLIDNALFGDTSRDAMRWAPDRTEDLSEPVVFDAVAFREQLAAMQAAFNRLSESFARPACSGTFLRLADALTDFSNAYLQPPKRASRLHLAYSRRKRGWR